MKTLRIIYHYSHRWLGILIGILVTIGTVHGLKAIIRATEPGVFENVGYVLGIDVVGFMLYILLIENNVNLCKRLLRLAEKPIGYKLWSASDEMDLIYAEEYHDFNVKHYKYMHKYHQIDSLNEAQLFETTQMYQSDIDDAEVKMNALKERKNGSTVLQESIPNTFKTKLTFK